MYVVQMKFTHSDEFFDLSIKLDDIFEALKVMAMCDPSEHVRIVDIDTNTIYAEKPPFPMR